MPPTILATYLPYYRLYYSVIIALFHSIRTVVNVAGGTPHRKGMPGFIKDLTLYSGRSHIGRRMNDMDFNNKVLVASNVIM